MTFENSHAAHPPTPGLTTAEIVLERAIFGYERGHRLIGSSIQLDHMTEARLLEMTDPYGWGIFDGRRGPAIAVLPLPELGFVAIARIVPDLEAGRPGAVFSDVLLIKDVDLGRVADPSPLLHLPLRRDLHSTQHKSMEPESGRIRIAEGLRPGALRLQLPLATDVAPGSPLGASVGTRADEATPWPVEWGTTLPLTAEPARELITALYSENSEERTQAAAGDALPSTWLAIVGQIWAQQWPALRKHLAFSTIPVRAEAAAMRWFTLAPLVVESHSNARLRNSEPLYRSHNDKPSWVDVAAFDLHLGQTAYRRFLRAYAPPESGRDGYTAFSILTKAFAELEACRLSSAQRQPKRAVVTHLTRTARLLTTAYPNRAQMRSLKTDVFVPADSEVIGSRAHLDVSTRLATLLTADQKITHSPSRAPIDALVDTATVAQLFDGALRDEQRWGELETALRLSYGFTESTGEQSGSSFGPLLSLISETIGADLRTSSFAEMARLAMAPSDFITAVLRSAPESWARPAIWSASPIVNALIKLLHDSNAIKQHSAQSFSASDLVAAAWDAKVSGDVIAGIVALLGLEAVPTVMDLLQRVDAWLPPDDPWLAILATHTYEVAEWMSAHDPLSSRPLLSFIRVADPRDAAWDRVDPEAWSSLLLCAERAPGHSLQGLAAAFFIAATDRNQKGADLSATAWRAIIRLVRENELDDRAWQILQKSRYLKAEANPDPIYLIDVVADIAVQRQWKESQFRAALPDAAAYDIALRRLATKRSSHHALSFIDRILVDATNSGDAALRGIASTIREIIAPPKTKPKRRRPRK